MSFQKATQYCKNRLFEWISAGILTQMGLLILFLEYIRHDKPQLSFIAFQNLGLSVTGIGLLFLILGGGRMLALFHNGGWKHGWLIRAIGAACGIAIWAQLLYGIIMIIVRENNVYLSLVIWEMLIVGEYVSLKRAILDQRTTTTKA